MTENLQGPCGYAWLGYAHTRRASPSRFHPPYLVQGLNALLLPHTISGMKDSQ